MKSMDEYSMLYERLSHEQDLFRSWLLHQSPEEILKHTYEYTTREDILMAFSEMQIADDLVSALLTSPSPMQEIYKNFSNKESDYMDSIRYSIEETAKTMLKRESFNTKYEHFVNIGIFSVTFARFCHI